MLIHELWYQITRRTLQSYYLIILMRPHLAANRCTDMHRSRILTTTNQKQVRDKEVVSIINKALITNNSIKGHSSKVHIIHIFCSVFVERHHFFPISHLLLWITWLLYMCYEYQISNRPLYSTTMLLMKFFPPLALRKLSQKRHCFLNTVLK